jgi:hypothetical protein
MASVENEPKVSTDNSLDLEKAGAVGVTEEDNKTEEIQYPGWSKLFLIMIALYLSMFLIALVR